VVVGVAAVGSGGAGGGKMLDILVLVFRKFFTAAIENA
jgi:hypothetical protein